MSCQIKSNPFLVGVHQTTQTTWPHSKRPKPPQNAVTAPHRKWQQTGPHCTTLCSAVWQFYDKKKLQKTSIARMINKDNLDITILSHYPYSMD